MPVKAGVWTQNGGDGADPVGSRQACVDGTDDVPSHLSALFSVSGTPVPVLAKRPHERDIAQNVAS